ncbi:hypothetical protein AMTRI_Chr09g20740 [Amborella trichopoda]
MEVPNVLHMNEGARKLSYPQNSLLQKKLKMSVLSLTFITPQKIGNAKVSTSLSSSEDLSYFHRKQYYNKLSGSPIFKIFKRGREVLVLVIFKFFMSLVGMQYFLDSGCCTPINSSFLELLHLSFVFKLKVPPGLYDEYGKPLNKGNLYITEDSPSVTHAFLQQFQGDFSLFLKFLFIGRRTKQAADKEGGLIWTPLSQAIKNLVSKGFIEEEKLDSFDLPYYGPSAEEVQEEVKREGSFTISRFKQIRIAPWGANQNGKDLALMLRAAAEPLIKYQFGEEVMDILFEENAELIQSHIDEGKKKLNHCVLVLKRSNCTHFDSSSTKLSLKLDISIYGEFDLLFMYFIF